MAGLMLATLGDGSLGGLVWKKVSRVQRAEVLEEPTSWKALAGAGCLISWIMSSTSMEALSVDEVAGMRKVEGRNWTDLTKSVPLVAGS